jgi:hypothetical protein
MIIPDFLSFAVAFLGGLFATLLMIAIEIPSWKRWGLQGVLEWHENQILSVKFFKLSKSGLHFKGIFLLHFLNGGLASMGFLMVLELFPITLTHLFFSGIMYGFFLWVATLIPIHKLITGISPWHHPNGIGPFISSLIGHVVYGVVIGYFFLNLPI